MRCCIGIDLAKRKHSAAVIAEGGERRLLDFEFRNDGEGFAALLAKLTEPCRIRLVEHLARPERNLRVGSGQRKAAAALHNGAPKRSRGVAAREAAAHAHGQIPGPVAGCDGVSGHCGRLRRLLDGADDVKWGGQNGRKKYKTPEPCTQTPCKDDGTPHFRQCDCKAKQ